MVHPTRFMQAAGINYIAFVFGYLQLQIRTMPDLMYKLLTGQVLPEYY